MPTSVHRRAGAAEPLRRARGPLLPLLLLALAGCSRAPSGQPALQGDLHLAAWRGDLGRLRAALEPHARERTAPPAQSPDIRERGTEWTPLHVAAMAGRGAAASLLLDRGADPNARARYDLTPLHWAALLGQADAAALLLARGARPDARDLYGQTPLHLAANEHVARALLDRGASHEAADDLGMTPLHIARGRQVARALLERGASPVRRARDGRTSMEITVWDDLERHGLTLFARGTSARLRGAASRFDVRARNVGVRDLPGLALSAESRACGVDVTPARVAVLHPGQMVAFTLALSRRPGVGDGAHPLRLRLRSGGRELAVLPFHVDTTQAETPEDRGEIRVASALVQRRPPRWHYAAYAAGPLLVLALWLLVRRRR